MAQSMRLRVDHQPCFFHASQTNGHIPKYMATFIDQQCSGVTVLLPCYADIVNSSSFFAIDVNEINA